MPIIPTSNRPNTPQTTGDIGGNMQSNARNRAAGRELVQSMQALGQGIAKGLSNYEQAVAEQNRLDDLAYNAKATSDAGILAASHWETERQKIETDDKYAEAWNVDEAYRPVGEYYDKAIADAQSKGYTESVARLTNDKFRTRESFATTGLTTKAKANVTRRRTAYGTAIETIQGAARAGQLDPESAKLNLDTIYADIEATFPADDPLVLKKSTFQSSITEARAEYDIEQDPKSTLKELQTPDNRYMRSGLAPEKLTQLTNQAEAAWARNIRLIEHEEKRSEKELKDAQDNREAELLVGVSDGTTTEDVLVKDLAARRITPEAFRRLRTDIKSPDTESDIGEYSRALDMINGITTPESKNAVKAKILRMPLSKTDKKTLLNQAESGLDKWQSDNVTSLEHQLKPYFVSVSPFQDKYTDAEVQQIRAWESNYRLQIREAVKKGEDQKSIFNRMSSISTVVASEGTLKPPKFGASAARRGDIDGARRALAEALQDNPPRISQAEALQELELINQWERLHKLKGSR